MKLASIILLILCSIVVSNAIEGQVSTESSNKMREAEDRIILLKRENAQLREELLNAEKEIRVLSFELANLQAKYKRLTESSKAYTEAIRKQFKALQQKVTGLVRAEAWGVELAERKAMVAEVNGLRSQVADEDKAGLAALSKQIYQLEAYGEVLDAAKGALANNYDQSAVNTAASNLKRADVSGFSAGIVAERRSLLALLDSYCTQYARVKDLFRQFNELNKPATTLRLLPKLMTGADAVPAGHSFIRKELEWRKDNPSATDQPFSATTNCK